MNRLNWVVIFSLIFLSTFFYAMFAHGQVLSYLDTDFDGLAGVDGLDGAYGVVVSPDNKHVYTASSTDDAVTAFSINTSSGELTYLATYWDDGQPSGTIAGLHDAKRLAISPDGLHIYVPSSTDDAIVTFSRNTTSGELTYLDTQYDGVAGIDGLNGAFEATVSADGANVYVAGSSDDAIAVFTRNAITGKLTFLEVHRDGVSGVDGINSARSIAISPDGNHAYAVGSIDDAVAIFSRNAITGALTYMGALFDGVAGVDGLNGAYSIIVSPDNSYVYVASSSDDAVAVFWRHAASGKLAYVECHKDDSQGGSVSNLNAARAVAITHDGSYVYAVSSSDDALVAFARDAFTGTLTVDTEFPDGINSVDGLNGARFIAIAPDDNFLFTVSSADDAVSTFASPAILPIELVSFEGILNGNQHVNLEWTTASETNNDYFAIERSTDGIEFSTIGQLSGASFSTQAIQYSYIDQLPADGINYYRLKQVDADEAYTYSKVIMVDNQPSVADPVFMMLYPNPCQSNCQIMLANLDVHDHPELELLIHNATGQQVAQETITPLTSSATLTLPAIDQYPKGLYLVTVIINESEILTEKLVIDK